MVWVNLRARSFDQLEEPNLLQMTGVSFSAGCSIMRWEAVEYVKSYIWIKTIEPSIRT